MFKRSILYLALLLSLLTLALPTFPRSASAVTGSVVTSQLGFAPGDAKVGVLAVPSGTPVQQTFHIIESTTNTVAYSSRPGEVQYLSNGWYGNNGSGDTYVLDFSAWAPASGQYVIESNGLRSFPFRIGADVYDARRLKPLEFFRVQQSGASVAWRSLDGISGSHGPDHLDDAREAKRADRGGGDRSLIEQDYLQLSDDRLNVVGGWFDAGDYNKYMGNTPWAAYLLLLSYEDYRSYWSGVDDNANGQSDLPEYVRPALEWMLKMQHSDGSVYERIFNGYAAAFDGRPDLETDNTDGTRDDRPLDTDRYADITAKSTYAMATAYRIFGDQRYLNMATKAWDWAYANQGSVKAKRYGGGLYFGDVEIGLTLGALEIHRAQVAAGLIPDPKYLNYASARVQSHLATADWVNPSSWDFQQSFALTRYFDFASTAEKTQILDQIKGRWDAGITFQNRNAYRMNDEWLYSDFGQNDLSASSAGDALWVFGKTGDRKYYSYAVNQIAWILGRNPFGESWLASPSVREYTRVPHWRATAKHPIEGVVVPGATDRDSNRIPDYTDSGDWFYSEPTINQQAMFARVMAALFHASGGSAGPPPPTDLPPIVSITSPADGALVSGTVGITSTASDDVGVSSVSYRVDGGQSTPMALASGTAKAGTWQANLDTTQLPDGQHSIAVVASDTANHQATASIAVNVSNGATPRLHVERIEVALVSKGNSSKIQAKSDTYIYDAFGRPVPGAVVAGHWEGAATDTYSGTTDDTGKVTDYSNSADNVGSLSFTWVVDSAAKSGWIYDAAANKQTRATVTSP